MLKFEALNSGKAGLTQFSCTLTLPAIFFFICFFVFLQSEHIKGGEELIFTIL